MCVLVASTLDPEPRSASNTPIICSAVAGGIIIIIIIVSGLLYFRRRRDQNQMPGSAEEHEVDLF